MRLFLRRGIICLILLSIFQYGFVANDCRAGEKEERIQALQEKMAKLKKLLEDMEEQQLREQPPGEIPWQAIQKAGEERPAYAQYAYFLAPEMKQEELDSILQQISFLAGQDDLKERGNLFVVTALPRADGEQMDVDHYHRELAGKLLQRVGIPKAIEGGLLVVPGPLDEADPEAGSVLFIDLKNTDRILRSRIFERLHDSRLFSEDGSIHLFLWQLLEDAAPREFIMHRKGNLTWVAAAE